jgi:hypothetical protein
MWNNEAMRQFVRFVLSVWVLALMGFGAYSVLAAFKPWPLIPAILATVFFGLPSAWLALGLALKGVPALMDAAWPVKYERKPSPMPPDVVG